MKFRVKISVHTCPVTIEDINEESTIFELKNKIKKRFTALRKIDFRISLNGHLPLEETERLQECGLVNGDTIYVLLSEEQLRDLIPCISTSTLVPTTTTTSSSLLSNVTSSICNRNTNMNPVTSSSSGILTQPLTLDEVRNNDMYPIIMHKLCEHSMPQTNLDFIVLAIHVLMLENGFQMVADNEYDLTSSKKSDTFYVIRYHHKLCGEENLCCSLAIMKTDTLVTVDGVINSISQACGKLLLKISNYLYTQKEMSALQIQFPYHDLRNLSCLFKDNISNKLLCRLLEESGQTCTASLAGLPNEIKLRLVKYLPLKSLLALKSACRGFHTTMSDNLLWQYLCNRDFDKTAIMSISQTDTTAGDWYQRYKTLYIQKQAVIKQQYKTPLFHPSFFPIPSAVQQHRLLFQDGVSLTAPTFHPLPLYRPIPPGVFRKLSNF
ncbi:unnamed protein product [Didymodactylos carnosus]|uniref:F-box domain-containing protein n=1 Tax=Didymodactylos carnosus TaxID=1234261 RepID=A0A815WS76_9BILA|nr:unnamed protein product [Didymodactylos carnosus]CAF4412431.1 unnamed protein product [Didymodactylos carnosus]